MAFNWSVGRGHFYRPYLFSEKLRSARYLPCGVDRRVWYPGHTQAWDSAPIRPNAFHGKRSAKMRPPDGEPFEKSVGRKTGKTHEKNVAEPYPPARVFSAPCTQLKPLEKNNHKYSEGTVRYALPCIPQKARLLSNKTHYKPPWSRCRVYRLKPGKARNWTIIVVCRRYRQKGSSRIIQADFADAGTASYLPNTAFAGPEPF